MIKHTKIIVLCSAILLLIAAGYIVGKIFWTTNGSNKDRSDVLMAETIFREVVSQNFLEHSIISQVRNDGLDVGLLWWQRPLIYLSVWKYEKGRAVLTDQSEIDRVIKEKNGFLIVFLIHKKEGDTIFVDVVTDYPKSKTPGFPSGGNASHWQMEFVNSEWAVKTKDVFFIGTK